jgi:glycosyltransferase involved in cell wall biosynthesis
LHILSLVTPKHPFLKGEFPDGYIKKTHFTPIFVDTTVNAVDAFVNLVTQDSYHVSRFFSSDVDKHIHQVFEEKDFDFVILESIFTAPYIDTIRRLSKAKIVMRSHNLEFSIWHRIAKSKKLGLKKTYLRILTKQLKDYEVQILQQIDGLIAINPDELKHYKRLGLKKKSTTIPFAVELDKYQPEQSPEPKSVFHLGSMDWQPNVEGIEWFLHRVWPIVVKKAPDLKLYLAGRRMPQWLLEHEQEGVEVVGEVEEAQDFIKSKNIMIIPLKSGGGMRVKLVEALALEKPVVSTPLGANGVSVKDGKNILLARQPREFANAILSLLDGNGKATQLGANGRKLVQEQYDSTRLSEKLVTFLKSLKK